MVNAFLGLLLFSSTVETLNAFLHQPSLISKYLSLNHALNTNYASFASSTVRIRGRSLTVLKSTKNEYYKGMDAYQILEIPRSADAKTIKSAYRKMVAKWHPDKFPDDDNKKAEGNLRMEKINRAYFCLGDEDRKRRYDQFGEDGVGTSAASEEQMKAAGGPNMGGFGGMGGQVDVNDISDIFDAFFGGAAGGGMRGGGARQQQQQQQQRRNPNAVVPGDDLQVEVQIPFMTAIFGGTENVKVKRMEECNTCTGSGVKPGAKMRSCSTCGGMGQVQNMQRTPFGVFSNIQPCPACRGSGQEVEDFCVTCRGRGANAEVKEVVVRIPAGVESGATLRVRDAGNAGKRGGPRGDLFCTLAVKKDPKFTREGMDIFSDEEISYVDAILGTTVKADTVDGKIDVTIPKGCQPEQKLRLRNKGAPKLGTTDFRGDQYITVRVKIPTSVSGKEKELIEQIAELEKKKGGGGFFSGFGGGGN